MSHPVTSFVSARLRLAAVALSCSAFALALLPAGEKLINNGAFDNLSPSPSWYWENWSLPNSSVTYDGTENAGGVTPGSGSLRLTCPFNPAVIDWQEAVFTLDIDDFDASLYRTVSFDVKVDPSSAMRAEGDYGNIQIILRNTSGWVWKEEAFVPLTSTEWTKVTVNLADGQQTIEDVRAITIRIAQSLMVGDVIVYVDNIAFNDEVIIDNFDDHNVDGWTATWGTTPLISVGPDRSGRQTSSSEKVEGNSFTPSTSWQQVVTTFPLGNTVDAAALYTAINVDVKVDPASIPGTLGHYGLFEIKRPDGTAIGGSLLTNTDWVHLSWTIPSGMPSLNALLFQLGGDTLVGPITYYLDNLTWTKRTAPPPPPSLSLQQGVGGLNLVHTATDQYGRHNIYTLDSSGLGFVNELDPVTYSFDVASFPSAPGFQIHMFLVPGNPGSESSPDWNEPNTIYMDLKANEAGAANWVFRWKTNQANGNTQLYAAGLPSVNGASVLGHWSLTANGNGHFTMTAPDSTTASYDLPADALSLFTGPIRVYIGVQGNSTANVGQRAQLGGVKITKGDTVVLEDNFGGTALDTTK